MLGLLALAGGVAGCTFELAPSETAEPVSTRPIDARPAIDVRRPLDAEWPSEGPEQYPDLRTDEQAIVDLFENTSPSVVYITTLTQRRDIFGRNVTVPRGTGTGFIWDGQGHVVTNYHVVENAVAIRVVMQDQTGYIADYIGGSRRHDLAVLRIDAPSETLSRVQLGDSDRVRVGQSVYAIGNPFGLSATLTTGIVSALNRQIEGLTGDIIEDVIQIDAAINPGNSGGPLLDSGGFAVPVNTVQRVVPQLIANGEYHTAQLGVTRNQRLTRLVAQRFGVAGVVIDQVYPGSGAAAAGLRGTEPSANQLGDIILQIDGQAVPSFADLRLVLDRYQPGDDVTVTLSRDGKTLDAVVTLM